MDTLLVVLAVVIGFPSLCAIILGIKNRPGY
jgi:hypothetical protein